MGLADDLQQEWDELVSNPLIERCPIGKIRKRLNDADREAVDMLLGNPNATGVKVTAFLNEQGTKMQESKGASGTLSADDQELVQLLTGIGEGAVQKHRRGACKCKKEKAQK